LPNQPTSLVPANSRFPRMRLQKHFEGTAAFRCFCDSQEQRLFANCSGLGYPLRREAEVQVGTLPVSRSESSDAVFGVFRRSVQGCFLRCLTEKILHCTTFAVRPKRRLDSSDSTRLRPNRKGGFCDHQG